MASTAKPEVWPQRIARKMSMGGRAIGRFLNHSFGHSRRMRRLRKILGGVEIYQPIFRVGGHPALRNLDPVRRVCVDRLRKIRENIRGELQGLRILDVGPALGFFSLSLAEEGARVTGLEADPVHLEAARLISRLSGVPAEFEEGRFDEAYLDSIPEGRYQIGLFLSVFHHIIQAEGLARAQQLAARLLEKIPICYFELALREEPVAFPWRESLPAEPLELFKDLPVEVELLGMFPTHLSGVFRPLYRVMRKGVVTVNGRAIAYDRVEVKSFAHSLTKGNRAYYFSDRFFVKEAVVDRGENFEAFFQAINEVILMHRSETWRPFRIEGVRFPRMIDFEIDRNRIRVIFERAPGELLSDILGQLDEARKWKLLRRVETAALHLQSKGLLLNDLRVWNILFDRSSDEITIIDFGRADSLELENVWCSLAWMAAELDQGRILSLVADRGSLAQLGQVPWSSARLGKKFEEYRRRWSGDQRTAFPAALLQASH